MADKYSGWLAQANVTSTNSNTATSITVEARFKSNGWRYDMGPVYGYAICNGSEVCTANGVDVDTTADNQMSVSLGSHTFTINRTHSAQTIPCKAKVVCASTYVSGTKESGVTNITVPAKDYYAVSYNANGGSGAPSQQTKWYGETLTLSSTKPTKTGYNFSKWNTKSDGSGTNYNSGASYTSNAALSLYAIWTAQTYTVSYNANGGSGAPQSHNKIYGQNLALSSTIPTRTNYTFKGWATSSSGGVAYAAGGTYSTNAAITLYAVWELAYKVPRLTSFNAIRCNSRWDGRRIWYLY